MIALFCITPSVLAVPPSATPGGVIPKLDTEFEEPFVYPSVIDERSSHVEPKDEPKIAPKISVHCTQECTTECGGKWWSITNCFDVKWGCFQGCNKACSSSSSKNKLVCSDVLTWSRCDREACKLGNTIGSQMQYRWEDADDRSDESGESGGSGESGERNGEASGA